MTDAHVWKCSVFGCDSTSKRSMNHLYCNTHYQRTRRGKLPLDAPIQTKRKPGSICEFDGCEHVQSRRNWCQYHYWQWIRGREMTSYKRDTGAAKEWFECALVDCDLRARELGGICQKHRALARKYGMEYSELVQFWTGICFVCNAKNGLVMDHDHDCCPVGNSPKCGKCNRGILCDSCNKALGYLEDNRGRLLNAIKYLDDFEARKRRS